MQRICGPLALGNIDERNDDLRKRPLVTGAYGEIDRYVAAPARQGLDDRIARHLRSTVPQADQFLLEGVERLRREGGDQSLE
jgi:hypothetical protein